MSQLQTPVKAHMLQALLASVNVRAALIDTGVYTYSAAHEFLDDVTGIVDVCDAPFSAKTFTDGVFDAGNITFDNVEEAATSEAIYIYIDTGVAATSRLVAYITEADGLPVLSNGGPVNITWNVLGIFAL